MKKIYLIPEICVAVFEDEQIIATSLTIDGNNYANRSKEVESKERNIDFSDDIDW